MLALISLRMIFLLDNCTGNRILQALSQHVGHQTPSGLVPITNHESSQSGETCFKLRGS